MKKYIPYILALIGSLVLLELAVLLVGGVSTLMGYDIPYHKAKLNTVTTFAMTIVVSTFFRDLDE